MNTDFTAQIIRSSADGIAGLAAARLFEDTPQTPVETFTAWKAHLKDMTLQLAAALQSQNIESFADHMAWKLVAFQSTNVPSSEVILALNCLDEVAIDSVPPGTVSQLTPILEEACKRLSQEKEPSQSYLSGEGPNNALAQSYVSSLRAGDETKATNGIMDAFEDQALTIETIVDEVLIPSLSEIGRLWHLGQATVAEEHFVTQATHKMLAQLLAKAPKQSSNGKTALLSGVAGEGHSFGIQVVSGYLQIAGWRTICLGSNTPPADLARAARDFGAHVVMLGATMDLQIQNVVETVRLVREKSPESKVIVGGPAFNRTSGLWKKVGADNQAGDGQSAVRLAESCTG